MSIFLIKYDLHASRFLHCSFRKKTARPSIVVLLSWKHVHVKQRLIESICPHQLVNLKGLWHLETEEGSWHGGCSEPTAVLGRPHVPSAKPVIPEGVLALFSLWQLHIWGSPWSCLEKVAYVGVSGVFRFKGTWRMSDASWYPLERWNVASCFATWHVVCFVIIIANIYMHVYVIYVCIFIHVYIYPYIHMCICVFVSFRNINVALTICLT